MTRLETYLHPFDIEQLCQYITYFASHNTVSGIRKPRVEVVDRTPGIDDALVFDREIVFTNESLVVPDGFMVFLEDLYKNLDKNIPKAFGCEYDEQLQEYKITINDLLVKDLNQRNETYQKRVSIGRKKRKKIFKTKPKDNSLTYQNITIPVSDQNKYQLVMEKKFRAETFDVMTLNLTQFEDLKLRDDIIKEIKFFNFSPKELETNSSLLFHNPSLTCHFSAKDSRLSISLHYSLAVLRFFEAKNTISSLNISKLKTVLFDESRDNTLYYSCPTYYQLGYEFLNEWNAVSGDNMTIEAFEENFYAYSKETTIRTKLSDKIEDVLSKIKNPGSKLFYNLLTEYASRLRAPVSLNHIKTGSVMKKSEKNSLSVPGLNTSLFNFQAKTLLWCLDKENVDYDFQTKQVKNRALFQMECFKIVKGDECLYNYNYLSKKMDKVVFGWVRLVTNQEYIYDYEFEIIENAGFFEKLAPKSVYWFNKYTGNLISTKAVLEYFMEYCTDVLPDFTDPSLVVSNRNKTFKPSCYAQNLLSEEMGLGKTIELMSLVLSNPRKDFKRVYTSESHHGTLIDGANYVHDLILNRDVLKTKTTLIVCPESIFSQWNQEITKFAPSLKILLYRGHNEFYNELQKKDKLKESLRNKKTHKKKMKFVVSLKYDPGKIGNNDLEVSSMMGLLLNFNTFGPTTTKDLDLVTLVDSQREALNLTKFKVEKNVRIKFTSLGDNLCETIAIQGIDNPPKIKKDHEIFSYTDIEYMFNNNTVMNLDPKHKRVAYELSQYDIIVASYQTITREMHYAKFNPDSRPTRTTSGLQNYHDDEFYDEGPKDEEFFDEGIRLTNKRHDYSSPLVLLQFWRIILDEVQMVSSSVTNAAKTCKIFSRCHSWGISGTPIKKDLGDIMSYMNFLRIEPFNENTIVSNSTIYTNSKGDKAWDLLVNYNGDLKLPNDTGASIDFLKMITNLSIRHDKTMVKHDINLPKQRRVLLTAEFTPVEQDNYSMIFKKFLEEAGLNEKGEPVNNNFQINYPLMRKYLSILRKTCNYIDLTKGNSNSGNKYYKPSFEITTMVNILDRFIEESYGNINDTERKNIGLYCELAEIYEKKKDPYKFKETLYKYLPMVESKVQLVQEEIDKDKLFKKNLEDDEIEDEFRKAKRARFKTWMEYLHKFLFFLGNAYFQISELYKDFEDLSEEELNEKSEKTFELYNKSQYPIDEDDLRDQKLYSNMEKYLKNKVLEDSYYKKAEQLRNKLLISYSSKALASIGILKKSQKKFLDKIGVKKIAPPNLKKVEQKDLKILYFKLFKVVEQLDIQSDLINNWLNDLQEVLCTPLLKEDHDGGKEYEKTIIGQEKAVFLLSVVELSIKYRGACLNGITKETLDNDFSLQHIESMLSKPIFDAEVGIEKKKKKDEEEITIEEKALKEYKTKIFTEMKESRPLVAQEDGSGLEYNLKNLLETIKSWDDKRFTEHEIVAMETTIEELTDLLKDQNYSTQDFRKKIIPSFNNVYNEKAVYYKQLQAISDTVESTDFNKYLNAYRHIFDYADSLDELNFESLKKFLTRVENKTITDELRKNNLKISQANSRLMYLKTLKDEGQEEKDMICIICQTGILKGVLLECGHRYCRECINDWFKSGNPTCPLCKSRANKNSIYDFTFTRENLKVGLIEESSKVNASESSFNTNLTISKRKKFSFYEPLNDTQYSKISEMILESGNKFGAKINAILKLIKWLQQNQELDVQIVIFSQWEEFLRILALALSENQIKYLGYSKVNKNSKFPRSYRATSSDVNNFKYDSSYTCFLLNAQQQAAGLTLVNATHVILCEPLVNTALELQAINRIHRIGQRFETTVWMLGIAGTVEESVINLSTKKRLNQLSEIRDNSLSKHYAEIVNNPLGVSSQNEPISKFDLEDNQFVADSIDLTRETDKLMDKSGGELVSHDELWDSFFSTS